jgi:mannose-6-phosphate isomerase-like protein (cupin superfamily)
MKNNSKVIPCSSFHWEGVPRKAYKTEGSHFKEVHRYTLLGEGENEHELNMETRYFEIQAGGYSSLEMHRHPHSVVVIRGKGTVILGDEIFPIGLHDVVYISPETIHQFLADRGEPLGFLCIVDRYRDKPTIPTDAQLEAAMGKGEARARVRR